MDVSTANIDSLKGMPDVDFDFAVSAAVKRAFRAEATSVSGQRGSRATWRTTGLTDFRGHFSDVFRQNGRTQLSDLNEVVAALRQVATEIEKVEQAAREENQRRATAREWAQRQANRNGFEKWIQEHITGEEDPPAVTLSDSPPFRAGGQMRAGNSLCTNGFAIRRNSSLFTTTARHCRSSIYETYDTGIFYGGTQAYTPDGAARVLYKQGHGSMFRGAWMANTSATAVGSLRDVGINSVVCTGGANSGEHCSIKVTAMSVSTDDGYGVVSMIRAEQQGGGIAAASGDSGGPVFVIVSGKVGAIGMMQATGNLTTCPSLRVAGTAVCGKRVLFTSMRTIVNSWGATLVTS